LRIVAAELRSIDKATAETHYSEHIERSFFGDLVAFITRGPAMVAVVEGPEGTVAMVRELMGETDGRLARSGTIRGDLASGLSENLIHGSDSDESAAREISLFFPDLIRGS
ncbi:MAG: nucleoside-diphosphate kinase, partial [Pseudonocardiaceae bacterium]